MENIPPVRSTINRSSVCPWLLWMVIAHASLHGNCVNVPITSRRSAPPSTTGRVASHVYGVTSSHSPSGNSTSTTSPPRDSSTPTTRPMVPFTQRPPWSLLSIMICAPALNRSTSSAGGSNSDRSPDTRARWTTSLPGSRSSCCRLRADTSRFVGASVSQNSSSGGTNSGSVRPFSCSWAWPSNTPSRISLRMAVIRSSPSWRNTVVNATVGKSSRRKLLAEKKYGVSYVVEKNAASPSVTTGGSWYRSPTNTICTPPNGWPGAGPNRSSAETSMSKTSARTIDASSMIKVSSDARVFVNRPGR